MIRIRPATAADLPALRELIPRSVRELSRGFHTPAQVESALRHGFGPDTALIADGTYFLAETAGGDQMKAATPHAAGDELLDPAAEPARIRAFFARPDHARRGAATALLRVCAEAARAAGFVRLELAAPLPGVPFYLTRGFVRGNVLDTTLADGTGIAFVQMSATMASLSFA